MSNATKSKGESKQSELEALKAELLAAKAEIETLKASKPVKEATAKQLARQAWRQPAAVTAPYDTILGKAQRMDHEKLLVALFKTVRALKHDSLPLLLKELVQEAAKNGGESGSETIDSVWEDVTKNRSRK